MRNTSFFILLLSFGLTYGQNHSDSYYPEEAPDSIIFEAYLDSIAKFLYMDSNVSMAYKEKCEIMIQDGKELSVNNRFRFIIENIYIKFLDDDAIGALEIIENNREFSNHTEISKELKNRFSYLSGFTSMSLSDYESAQRISYELLNTSLTEQDRTLQIQASQMLGTIYEEQNEYDKAIEYYLMAYSLSEGNPNTKIHSAYNLVRTYITMQNISEASEINAEALHLADSLDYLVFKFDLLRQKIDLLLVDKNIRAAYMCLEQSFKLAKELNNETHIAKCMEAKAEILQAQKKPAEGLHIYEDLIEAKIGNELIPSDLLRYYSKAHVLAEASGQFDEAYRYFKEYNKIKDQLRLQEQQQKVELLTVKFEIEQKDKNNQILKGQIAQKKSQNNLLSVISGSFALLAIGMYVLISQKKKYSKELEQKVAQRTDELKHTNDLLHISNNELNQFNKILYHDLKEPIRSIVGFSYLANENLHKKEYDLLSDKLILIEDSGKKLNQLVEDVHRYQLHSEQQNQKPKLEKISKIIDQVEADLSKIIETKNAQIIYSDVPEIMINGPLLYLSLKHTIENGIKFNRNNTPTINVSYERIHDYHRLIVSDNGIGIPIEYQENIFLMFSRLDNSKIHNGSGLGLSLIKKMLEHNDSRIRLHESSNDVGTTFYLEFPIL